MHARWLAALVTSASLLVATTAAAGPTEENWAIGGSAGLELVSPTGATPVTWGFHVRRVVVPSLSVGVSYKNIDSSGRYDRCATEDCPRHIDAYRAFVELHPLPASWVDPWFRFAVGVDVFDGSNTSVAADSKAPRDARAHVGFEGILGLDLHVPHFAIGPDLRLGLTSMGFGAHAEVRF